MNDCKMCEGNGQFYDLEGQLWRCYCRTTDNERYAKNELSPKIIELEQQNKRYREAIEKTLRVIKFNPVMSEHILRAREILNEALEE